MGIELTDSKGAVLTPNGRKYSTPQTLSDGANTLRFNAGYKSTLVKVTPRQADADATFTMQYN